MKQAAGVKIAYSCRRTVLPHILLDLDMKRMYKVFENSTLRLFLGRVKV